jgi:hypothetical protein
MLVASDVLPMPGRPGEDDQVGGLQAAHAGVERMNAGRNAGQMAVALEGGIGHVDRDAHRVGKRLEAAVVAPGLGQFEQPAFGILDLVLRAHFDRRVIGDIDHVLADADQRAPRRQIVDRAAVVLGIDDRHRFGGEPARDTARR